MAPGPVTLLVGTEIPGLGRNLSLPIFISGGVSKLQAILVSLEAANKQQAESVFVSEVMGKWGSLLPLPPVPDKVWAKKNPEVSIPVKEEVDMTPQQWSDSNFPFYDIPDEVTTHVDTKVWEDKVRELSADGLRPPRLLSSRLSLST